MAVRDELAKFSKETLAKTRGAKTNATQLLTEAQKLAQSIPDFDVEELNREIQLVFEEAEDLSPAVNR